MTDATHAVTQSAIEAIAREYLKGLGGTIREDGRQWNVSLPAHVDVEFSDRSEFEIVLDSEESETEEASRLLTPESEFTQQLLTEAAQMATIGEVALTADTIDRNYTPPSWITAGDSEVIDATFTPYYDKTAICLFVKVGVETVSKYQTQFLEAVAVDLESESILPRIPSILLSKFFAPRNVPRVDLSVDADPSVSSEKLTTVITSGQEYAVEHLEGDIDELRRSASESAGSEFEEYRQLQEQRIPELQNEINSIADRIQKLADKVDTADSEQQRVEALEMRSELKAEKQQAEAELSEILQEKESGYSQKKEDIYDRHAIEVITSPIAITFVSYERGEAEFTIGNGKGTAALRAPYAIGAGVTEDVRCQNCSETLSESNPVCVTSDGQKCQTCR
ncbi:hypothetical protein SAMN04487949_3292 [Halogranum gelatinilyticum]|uniref:Uncharacterized protein n=1 Tax=Halogranum gelatinilyticum TaxID=660521 RepID=A0A1G9YI35_9EURY|nr:hypothetical protein [Halogranum gelatinilyticum]SDN08155.1 hypothetical protein SAMN04487949_3292 [Halogranum gelatinilyticum]